MMKLTCMIVLAIAVTGGVNRKAAHLNNGANQLFDQKNFEMAAEQYEEAQTRAPEAPAIAYNLGNTLFREGKFADAAAHLKRGADSSDPLLRQKSLYNLGNALHAGGKLQEAANAYRHALALDPKDRDAKINYEKALQELQQQQKQQQQQGGKDSKKDQQDQQNQQQQQGGQQQNSAGGEQQKDQGKDAKPQDAQGQEGQDKQGEKPEDQKGQEGKDPQHQSEDQNQQAVAGKDSVAAGDLSREEAVRILEAMRDQEKELQKERSRKRVRSRRVEKDW